MSEEIHEESAGIIVFRKIDENIVFLCLKYAAGHWDFPKGHLELGEDAMHAAVRELYEETGLSRVHFRDEFVKEIFYEFEREKVGHRRKKVTFFLGEGEDEHIRLSDEHTESRWLNIDESRATVTFDSARDVLNAVEEYLKMTGEM